MHKCTMETLPSRCSWVMSHSNALVQVYQSITNLLGSHLLLKPLSACHQQHLLLQWDLLGCRPETPTHGWLWLALSALLKKKPVCNFWLSSCHVPCYMYGWGRKGRQSPIYTYIQIHMCIYPLHVRIIQQGVMSSAYSCKHQSVTTMLIRHWMRTCLQQIYISNDDVFATWH